MKFIDDLLNRITMYRLVLYCLLLLAATAIAMGFIGVYDVNGFRLLASALIFVASCYVANKLIAKLYGATTNIESALITGLILFCIFSPPHDLDEAFSLAFVGVVAMATKYIIAVRKRHIFNPAAIAAVIVSLLGLIQATWWMGNTIMWPFVLVLGLLVVRKIHRFHMYFTFLAAALIGTAVFHFGGRSALPFLSDTLISSPLLFLGAFMLTEPFTTPPTKQQQIIYGGVVGVLVGMALRIGPFAVTPEIALIIGNLFAYTTLMRRRIPLRLVDRRQLASNIYEFAFDNESSFSYQPGQYLELTLPIAKSDSRGNRRTFTIASSPTEEEVKFGIKFSNPSSAFKTALLALPQDAYVYTNHLAGEFILPDELDQKLAFIAGGIGITPFRSQLRFMVDEQESRDIVLLYQVAEPQQAVYADTLMAAEAYGLKTIYVSSTPTQTLPPNWENGSITKEMIAFRVPDYKERIFYISGPNGMVISYKKLLLSMGIKRSNIVTDYFAGY